MTEIGSAAHLVDLLRRKSQDASLRPALVIVAGSRRSILLRALLAVSAWRVVPPALVLRPGRWTLASHQSLRLGEVGAQGEWRAVSDLTEVVRDALGREFGAFHQQGAEKSRIPRNAGQA